MSIIAHMTIRIILTFLLLLSGSHLFSAEFYELEPILYLENEGEDSVKNYFEENKIDVQKWKFEPHYGYLRSALDALDIPVSSQTLVYSKTSFQITYITPQKPRAIYFNDEIYLGWVNGSDTLELSVASPQNGTNFYTISPRKNKPDLYRETHDCLQCHGSSRTRYIPGHLIRSVYPKIDGHAIFKAGSDLVDLQLPYSKRFGGWYVTGLKSDDHRGNLIFKETESGAEYHQQAPRFISPLKLDHQSYLSKDSDIIAHLVLQHQAQVHNGLAKLTLTTQKALHDQKVFDELLERDGTLVESTLRRIHHAADDLLEALFFYEEATPFPDVDRHSTFKNYFEALGPKDKKDRSLRKFDLHTKLFRYPLSYLIYTDSYLQLPKIAKDYVNAKIKEVLNKDHVSEKYNYIDERDKGLVLSILKQTHPDFK